MRFFIHTILTMFLFSNSMSIASENIPNLVGTWVGINKTVSEDRGYRSWEKKVEILEQDERRFDPNKSMMVGHHHLIDNQNWIREEVFINKKY